LLLAGLAAYRSDQLRVALCSLDLAPNEELNALYEDARRELQADRSNARLLSAHIALRYEGGALSDQTARFILAALEEDYSRISAQLGCDPGERIVVIVQSREQYLRGTGAAEWSGGHYDGRIHIAWSPPSETEGGASDSGPRIRRALAHELAHACLTSIDSGANPWPIWLPEGLAQKISGDRLSPAVREQLRQSARAQGIPRLENLGQEWFRLSRQDAVAAYNICLAAVDELDDNGILNLLTHPETLPSVTWDLDAEFGL
jgi:hypothetical protein